jgi:hypothetical protein
MHAFVGQDATSIALGESVGGLTGIMFRRCCEARSKYFSAWTLAGALPARGGLEPRFMVLFSAIFHGVPSEIVIRVENRGFWWKQNCCKLLQV